MMKTRVQWKRKNLSKCRVCGAMCIEKPLFHYKNMPASAQHLPEKKNIKHDRGVDLLVYECSGCGLVQLSNEPVPYYKDVIRAISVSEEMKRFRRHQFLHFIKKYSLTRKKIIEIGCGRGEYLSLMHECHVRCFGIEHNQKSVHECERKGLEVTRGFIEASTRSIPNSPFDAFFTLQYLEHLPDPRSTLIGIRNILTDDAIGLIEVPNFDMILQKHIVSEFIRDHLSYFTKKTLTRTLEMNGFDVIDNSVIWHDYIISAVVQKRKITSVSHFFHHQKEIQKHIDMYLHSFKGKKIAVWGAGHQALTSLSLFHLVGKITYIIDSARCKQNTYSPATHIPIVSPQALARDPVDAIIVMGAGYSDEIVKIIRQTYDKKIAVCILRDFGLEIV